MSRGGHGVAAQLDAGRQHADTADGQKFFGNGASGHAGDGFPAGRAAAAAVIAHAVLVEIAPVRMARAEYVRQIAVIAGALILVGHMEGHGRSRGDAFKNAGEDADGIRFLARRGRGAAAGFAQVEFPLQVFLAQGQTGGAAVEDAAEARAVGFAVGGEAQQTPKGIAGHTGSRKCLRPRETGREKEEIRAALCRPVRSERKNRVFSAKRQAVWLETRSVSN